MDVSHYREQARFALSGRWGKVILITLVAALFGGLVVGTGLSFNIEFDEQTLSTLPQEFQSVLRSYLMVAGGIGIILGIVQFFMSGPVNLGYCYALLKLMDGENPSVSDLFSDMYRFWDGFLLALLRALFTFLWTLLFIIPGIIAAYRYSMSGFIMAQNFGITPMNAIRASKAMMKHRKFELFLLDLSFIGWHLLAILSLGIGYIWLTPYINTTYAAFYRNNSYCFNFD